MSLFDRLLKKAPVPTEEDPPLKGTVILDTLFYTADPGLLLELLSAAETMLFRLTWLLIEGPLNLVGWASLLEPNPNLLCYLKAP
jgi:hypothetical protein